MNESLLDPDDDAITEPMIPCFIDERPSPEEYAAFLEEMHQANQKLSKMSKIAKDLYDGLTPKEQSILRNRFGSSR